LLVLIFTFFCYNFHIVEETIADYKEIIPEFYSLPHFLRNHLAFGTFGFRTPLADIMLGATGGTDESYKKKKNFLREYYLFI
jgi:hypothetical protein